MAARGALPALVLLAGCCCRRSDAELFLPLAAAGRDRGGSSGDTSILKELGEVLGEAEQEAMVRRVADVEGALQPIFEAMPKSGGGKLHYAAARYVLHRYLSEHHAWRVRGLADDGLGFAAAAPEQVLRGEVSESVIAAFEWRLEGAGLDLRELAALAVTFEGLVQGEARQRLNLTLKIMRLYRPKRLEAAQVDRLLETYMLAYLQDQQFQTMSTTELAKAFEKIDTSYPAFNETREFLRQARATGTGTNKTVYTLVEVEALVEDIIDQYGHWQNRECQDLKSRMVALEDSNASNSAGRVRLADFYASAVRDGNWQFSETEEYLAAIGALDQSDHSSPQVIIPNYVSGMSNCIARSQFYSICCADECTGLLSSLERHFRAPTATAAEIADFVSALPSSTEPAGRALPVALLSRLEEISEFHSGHVPLHGRLFAQWLHLAYPRECPYPHVAGSTQPMRQEEYLRKHQRRPNYKKEEIPRVAREAAELQAAGIGGAAGKEDVAAPDVDKCSVSLNLEEELHLEPPGPWARLLQRIRRRLHSVLHFAVATGALSAAWAQLQHPLSECGLYAAHKLGKGEGFIV